MREQRFMIIFRNINENSKKLRLLRVSVLMWFINICILNYSIIIWLTDLSGMSNVIVVNRQCHQHLLCSSHFDLDFGKWWKHTRNIFSRLSERYISSQIWVFFYYMRAQECVLLALKAIPTEAEILFAQWSLMCVIMGLWGASGSQPPESRPLSPRTHSRTVFKNKLFFSYLQSLYKII